MTLALLAAALLLAPQQGNNGNAKRLIPPPGIAVEAADRADLEAGLTRLAALLKAVEKNPLYPDAAIFHKAVRWSLDDGTIYNAREVASAKKLLDEGISRAQSLAAGKAPWTTQTGLVVRAYVSKLDNSIQPYGLVVPDDAFDGKDHRLDIWFHGRGENLTELSFCAERMRSRGEFAPPGAFVLHPYGRFCNANRLGGEVDVFEGLDSVKKAYRIDDQRLCVRGFSMGGASTWLFGTHHTDMWAAVAPGAGFSETAEFDRAFAPGKIPPPAYVQTLWNLYDSTTYAVNLANVPIIAYSGEIDGQRQAATRMVEAASAEGISFPHVIGEKAGHFYTPAAKVELEKFVTAAAEKGRPQNPEKIRFATYTLRYNKLHWLTVEAMGKHWEQARVEGEARAGDVTLTTKNVNALSLHLPATAGPVTLDGQRVGSGNRFARGADGRWKREERAPKGIFQGSRPARPHRRRVQRAVRLRAAHRQRALARARRVRQEPHGAGGVGLATLLPGRRPDPRRHAGHGSARKRRQFSPLGRPEQQRLSEENRGEAPARLRPEKRYDPRFHRAEPEKPVALCGRKLRLHLERVRLRLERHPLPQAPRLGLSQSLGWKRERRWVLHRALDEVGRCLCRINQHPKSSCCAPHTQLSTHATSMPPLPS